MCDDRACIRRYYIMHYLLYIIQYFHFPAEILPAEYGGSTSLEMMASLWAEVVAQHRDMLLGEVKTLIGGWSWNEGYPKVPKDFTCLSLMFLVLASQFHVYKYLTIMEKVPSRGLLHDCEIFGNLRITFVSSSSACASSGFQRWWWWAWTDRDIKDCTTFCLSTNRGKKGRSFEYSLFNCNKIFLSWL